MPRFFSCLVAMLYGCLFLPVCSQDLHYYHYTVDQGLPSSQVHDIVQDEYGYLWLATDHGLSRYDGYRFENYDIADGLTDNSIYKICKQANGELWCTTANNSIFRIEGKKPRFIPYRYNHLLLKIPDFHVSNILYFGADGSLYMSFINGWGYVHIDNQGNLVHKSMLSDLKTKRQTRLVADRQKGFFYYHEVRKAPDPIKGNWEQVMRSGYRHMRTDYVKACYIKKDVAVFANARSIIILNGRDTVIIPVNREAISMGRLTDELVWVGFRYGGLGLFNLEGKRLFTFLEGKSVTNLLRDHENGYWFSTLHEGIYHARNKEVYNYRHPEENSDWVSALAQDQEGRLWIGYYDGNVATLKSGKKQPFYEAKLKRPANFIYDRDTREVYCATDLKVFNAKHSYDVNTFLLDGYIYHGDSIFACRYGGIGLIYKQKKTDFEYKTRVRAVCYYNGKTYLALRDSLYYIKKAGKLVREFGPAIITDIDEYKGILYMATKDKGLITWQNGKVFRIDRSRGLSDNNVSEVYVENDSVVWACTNAGLNRIVLQNNQVKGLRIISSDDGLISNEITCVELLNDTVWVGTRQGLCYFRSGIFKKTKKNDPYYLNIIEIQVNDKTRSSLTNGLSYDENRVEFSFTGVSFSELNTLQYRYKLHGLEKHWNYTHARSALYASLPPGTYTFFLQAKREGAKWSTPKQYKFTIYPPFWKTWWFISSMMAFALLMVYLFFRFRILSYNRDITRELMRQLLKRMKRKTNHVVFREQGVEKRIPTETICYIRSDGNYIEIHTDTKKYVVRYKIGEFLSLVPDQLEYLRVNRSYIVRIDKIQEKGKKELVVKGEKIAVGETYLDELKKISF